MLLPSGNPFKYHEEVLYLQPIIPPKRFDIFSPDWGMLRRSRRVGDHAAGLQRHYFRKKKVICNDFLGGLATITSVSFIILSAVFAHELTSHVG